jgi:Protein of unknown function (DUF3631)
VVARQLHLEDPDVALGGAALLDEVLACLTRYVVFPSLEAADAVTLYAAATHAQHKLEFATRLVIKSPVKRCGKTRLEDVLGGLVHNPLATADISAAALVRSIGDNPPTIMLDEADAIFGKALKRDEKSEHLRSILNAGFGRGKPYIRWDVGAKSTEPCLTFAMAVIAGIGSLPDTIEDRAVIIALRRRTLDEQVQKYRHRRDKPEVERLGKRLAEWVRPLAEQIGDAEPVMPTGLNDRAEDCWEALLAVADLAGGDWPARGRKAAAVLSAEADDNAADASLSLRLLQDLCCVFGDTDALHSAVIIEALRKISEAPWTDYFGKPLSQRDLAKLLSPFGVKPCDVKIDGINRKGYRRAALYDQWQRYLPHGQKSRATSATSATEQVGGLTEVAGSGWEALPATSPTPLIWDVAEVAEVADPPYADEPASLLWHIPDAAETDPEADPDTAGPCTGCGRPTARYGPHINQICPDCRARPQGPRVFTPGQDGRCLNHNCGRTASGHWRGNRCPT